MRAEYREAAEQRDVIAEMVSCGYSLVRAAEELGIPYLRAKKHWRKIRENLGPQAV
jgi:molybdenum-dependent DNA-binding transcriptional regulator ModE